MMCGMHFRHELDYDATPDEVFEMLADPAFRERVSDALDVVSHSITMEPHADGFTLVDDQVQRTEGLPAIDAEHEVGKAWLKGER